MKKYFTSYLCILITLGLISVNVSAQSFCANLLLPLKSQYKYEIQRMSTGQTARELYEKMSYLPEQNLPQVIKDQQDLNKALSFKELSFYEGAVRIRVVRVAHGEFDFENMTTAEPRYYAQVLVSRSALEKNDSNASFEINDGEMAILLPRDNITGVKEDQGLNTLQLFRFSKTEQFEDDSRITSERCISGICSHGQYFIKWGRIHPHARSEDIGIRIILPFSISEGLKTQQESPSVIVNNNMTTFWGDVKSVLAALFKPNRNIF